MSPQKQDRWLGRFLFWACVAAVLIVLAGCATVEGCGTYSEGGVTGVECKWTSGPALR